MDIDLIFKIAAVGVIVAVINILLSKSGRDEQALMVTIAGLVIVLVVVVQEIGTLMTELRAVFNF
ncbi:MAG: stage III sporulation protein AC [Clostridia bacterium]|nr:stage III sporulation protein AC [Clostridia bacterium]